MSGLVINQEKSLIFLSEVDDELKTSLQDLLGFRQGSLPVKYLVVPLISTRLIYSDCKPLVEQIHSKIKLWFPASLTCVGCLQLTLRLHVFQIIPSLICILYGSQVEIHEHLFFQYHFSTTVWGAITSMTLMGWPSSTWHQLLQWACTRLKKKKEFTHLLAWFALSASVYFIWHDRNNNLSSKLSISSRCLWGHFLFGFCKDIFYLVWSYLVELKPRFRIIAIFRSIWRLRESWDIITLVVFEILFSMVSYIINW
jgi:hypothetical protein